MASQPSRPTKAQPPQSSVPKTESPRKREFANKYRAMIAESGRMIMRRFGDKNVIRARDTSIWANEETMQVYPATIDPSWLCLPFQATEPEVSVNDKEIVDLKVPTQKQVHIKAQMKAPTKPLVNAPAKAQTTALEKTQTSTKAATARTEETSQPATEPHQTADPLPNQPTSNLNAPSMSRDPLLDSLWNIYKNSKTCRDLRGVRDDDALKRKDAIPAPEWVDRDGKLGTASRFQHLKIWIPCPVQKCEFAFQNNKVSVSEHFVRYHYEDHKTEVDWLALPDTLHRKHGKPSIRCIFQDHDNVSRGKCQGGYGKDGYGRHFLSVHYDERQLYRCKMCKDEFSARDPASVHKPEDCAASTKEHETLERVSKVCNPSRESSASQNPPENDTAMKRTAQEEPGASPSRSQKRRRT
ncbi:hypothetical protein BDY19DRAFT_909410 [Irpex rosettiformis]|uniref:Uncharacterized protein n=1 Tax=Irpex rosettiformis TaxID=378272 RepID=A0ACB8TSK0_9APHY|nr:hypothetical protein BDY19DRAFT_909410 [Irpex rosettiformis]